MGMFVLKIIGALVSSIVGIYTMKKLGSQTGDYRNYKIYVVVIILTIAILLNDAFVIQSFKIISMTLVFSGLYYFLFDDKTISGIIVPVFFQFIAMIAETIYMCITVFIFKMDVDLFFNDPILFFITNLTISLLIYVIGTLKITIKMYNTLKNLIDKIQKLYIFFLMIIIVITINLIIYFNYNQINFTYLLLLSITLIFVYSFIVLRMLIEKNNVEIISNKYNQTLTSLKEYEEVLDKTRVLNHENKNQLLTIRSMIVKKEKNIPEYIDKLIDRKIKDDEKLMFDTMIIPQGGLRGIIYAKMLIIKDKNINYELKVNRNVRTFDLINMNDGNMVLDVCNVIGVFLDNAIEEVDKLDHKFISIELYDENKELVIIVANSYGNVCNVDKFVVEGYTTKGEGHGYGLNLVKKIVNENKLLSMETTITDDFFSQMVKIKM